MADRVNQATGPLRILRRPETQSRVGLARSTIYAMMKAGQFPKPIQLGPRAVGWVESEIDEWLSAKMKAHTSAVEKE
ncbi:prophage regulatory protein [Paraburkholderia sp. WC7.3g]|uniref:AlpA family transcriptional regulator n=1 Tax=Paraburkholderia sp. WC7.3g TaxID=2991070 RepID=UPI003D23EA45